VTRSTNASGTSGRVVPSKARWLAAGNTRGCSHPPGTLLLIWDVADHGMKPHHRNATGFCRLWAVPHLATAVPQKATTTTRHNLPPLSHNKSPAPLDRTGNVRRKGCHKLHSSSARGAEAWARPGGAHSEGPPAACSWQAGMAVAQYNRRNPATPNRSCWCHCFSLGLLPLPSYHTSTANHAVLLTLHRQRPSPAITTTAARSRMSPARNVGCPGLSTQLTFESCLPCL
jgi:hypothetical protein